MAMERERYSRPTDRWTLLAGVALLTALLGSGVVLAVWSDWSGPDIVVFLTAIAALAVPLLAQLRATHAQNQTLAKIDDQTNGQLDRRIQAASQKAAETALIRLQTGQLPTPPAMPPPPPPRPDPKRQRP